MESRGPGQEKAAIDSEWLRTALKRVTPWLCVIGGVAAAVILNRLGDATHQPSHLEVGLLTFISWGLNAIGAFLLGRQSAREAAVDMLRPHVRSAFRRLLAIADGLRRIADATSKHREPGVTDGFSIIEAITVEQLKTVSDSLWDWRDVVPEQVKELERDLRAKGIES